MGTRTTFAWRGRHYRFSLDRYHGRHVDSKTAAETLAELIRVAIRTGTFEQAPVALPVTKPIEAAPELTFEQLAQRWMNLEREGKVQTARDGRLDSGSSRRLLAIEAAEGTSLGHRAAQAVTEDDLESAFDALRQLGFAASTANHCCELTA